MTFLDKFRDRWVEFLITYLLILTFVLCVYGSDIKKGIIWGIIIASVNGLILLYRIKIDI